MMLIFMVLVQSLYLTTNMPNSAIHASVSPPIDLFPCNLEFSVYFLISSFSQFYVFFHLTALTFFFYLITSFLWVQGGDNTWQCSEAIAGFVLRGHSWQYSETVCNAGTELRSATSTLSSHKFDAFETGSTPSDFGRDQVHIHLYLALCYGHDGRFSALGPQELHFFHPNIKVELGSIWYWE